MKDGEASSSKGTTAIGGEPSTGNPLLPLLYDELRALASHSLRGELVGHTLQTTALANEAYLRLVDQRAVVVADRSRVMGLAAQAIRRILVDHARARLAAKRGGAWSRVDLEDVAELVVGRRIDVLALDEALTALEANSAQSARIVEMRFFGGLSEAEIAAELGVSTRTVERGWTFARRWLYRALSEHDQPSNPVGS